VPFFIMTKRQLVSVGYGRHMRVGYGGWPSGMPEGLLFVVVKTALTATAGKLVSIPVTIDTSVKYINTIEERDECLNNLNKIVDERKEVLDNYSFYLKSLNMMNTLFRNVKVKRSKVKSERNAFCGKKDLIMIEGKTLYGYRIFFGELNKNKKVINVYKKRSFNRYVALINPNFKPDFVEVQIPDSFEKYPVRTSADKSFVRKKMMEIETETQTRLEKAKEDFLLREGMRDMLLSF